MPHADHSLLTQRHSIRPLPSVMSNSSPLLTPQAQVTNVSSQNAPEEKVSVTMSNPIDLVTVDGASSGGRASLFVSSIGKDEPIVTRRELWSYYLYYNGNNGVGPNGYTMALFQSLATAAGYDPIRGPGSSCNTSGQCVLPWGGGTKAVASVVLIGNGVSFAVLTIIFTTVGSAADYGSFGRWLLLVITCISWASLFACLSLTTPSRWPVAMALFTIGFISYGLTLVFFAAVFPRLARNTAHTRKLRDKYETGEIGQEEYELEESLEKNRISNISTTHSNTGYIIVQCLNLSILIPLASNPKVDNYTIVLTTSYFFLLGIWWFIFSQNRPGPPLPKGESHFTIGWKQIWSALRQCRSLRYTFIYIFSFFLLADGLNTTTTLVIICQNDKFSFSFLQITYLGLAQAVPSALSTLGFWHIQRYFKIRTKTMFMTTTIVAVLIPFWGMLGIWTNKIGFHNAWEFWTYNVVYGLFQAPFFAYSQTLIAELTPPGFENMFFGLFGLSNVVSSVIGPSVIQAIIDQTGSNWMGFPFLFSLCFFASVIIFFFVNEKKGRQDAIAWSAKQRKMA